MLRYADLFTQSDAIGRILPRQISSPEELRYFYPSLLKETTSQANPDLQVTIEDEYKNADRESLNKATGEPIYDLLDRGGKQWRPLLGMMFAEAFGRDLKDFEANKDVYFACGLTEIVHNGSLMIDDIEDGSHKRRGDLCTHKKFGVDVAVNAGNFMMVSPMNMAHHFVPERHELALHRIFSEELQCLHVGQGWDIQWHNRLGRVPTEAQYFHMVENKTSVLPRMCLRFISELTQ